MNSISHIDIANCNGIQFAKTEVLSSKTQKIERQDHLFRAMLLNYIEHQPVSILFKNNQDHLFEIECAVIAVTDEHVMLKSGIILPVPSIVQIELL